MMAPSRTSQKIFVMTIDQNNFSIGLAGRGLNPQYDTKTSHEGNKAKGKFCDLQTKHDVFRNHANN
jgi:hypothetical protein